MKGQSAGVLFDNRGERKTTDQEAEATSQEEAEDRLITAEELAERTGISVGWIYKRARAKLIPSYKFGVAIRFSWEEVKGHFRVTKGGK